MRRIITKNLRTSAYNELINSHLAYGISIWGSSASQVKLNKCWSHIAPFSRLYLVKDVAQLKLATENKPIILLS